METRRKGSDFAALHRSNGLCFTHIKYNNFTATNTGKTMHSSAELYFAFIEYLEIRMKKAFLALYFLQTILISVTYTTYYEAIYSSPGL